jgi:hypothetical protein
MTIKLSFQRDEAEIADASPEAIAKVPAGVVDYSYLVFPVEFLVDGESLVYPERIPPGRWIVDNEGVAERSERQPETPSHTRRLPVLFFVRSLEESLSKVEGGGVAVVSVPGGGQLQLAGHDGCVAIVSEQGRRVDVSLSELKEAVAAFKQELIELLRSDLPWLISHPDLAPWLRSK